MLPCSVTVEMHVEEPGAGNIRQFIIFLFPYKFKLKAKVGI